MADPGFPRGGGANSPGGAPTYDFAKFSQKLHEIERIWAPRGGRASPAPPLRSATGYGHFRVPSQKFIWGSTSLIDSHDHICHKPPGGEFPIPTQREKRPVQSKIGSLQNIHHLPVVTDKKVFLSVTTRQQSYRKVMFSVVCISLSVYRRRVLCDHYP